MGLILTCHEAEPINFIGGQGLELTADTGRTFLDFESGVWSTSLGHNHPAVNQALKDQLDRISHLGYRFVGRPAEEAAAKLLRVLNRPDDRVVFLSSGSEAMEFCLRAAQRLTGQRRLVKPAQSYLGAYGLSGGDGRGWLAVDWDEPETDLGPAAALVLEPGSNAGRVGFPPPELIAGLAERVRDRGGLVVVDEVTSGLGRIGRWAGYQAYPELNPDLIAFGKTLGNGYPVSAVVMTAEVADRLTADGLRHVQSHQNDPLGCAAAGAVIDALRDEGLIEAARTTGELFLTRLEQAAAEWGVAKEIRGRGLMIGLEFEGSISAEAVRAGLLDRGFIVGLNATYNTVRFMPALVVTVEQIEALIAALTDLLAELGAGSN